MCCKSKSRYLSIVASLVLGLTVYTAFSVGAEDSKNPVSTSAGQTENPTSSDAVEPARRTSAGTSQGLETPSGLAPGLKTVLEKTSAGQEGSSESGKSTTVKSDAAVEKSNPTSSMLRTNKPLIGKVESNRAKSDKSKLDRAKSEKAKADRVPAKQEATEKRPIPTDPSNAREEKLKERRASTKSPGESAETLAEREQTALAFAGQHHPELVTLISPLKSSNPKEYQRAVKDLFRSEERLTAIREREPDRYELELELWKLQSRIRLLAARLTMSDDAQLSEQLREALLAKMQNRRRMLEYERELLAKRQSNISKELELLNHSQDDLVIREYERLVKKAQRDRQAISKGQLPKGSSEKAATLDLDVRTSAPESPIPAKK